MLTRFRWFGVVMTVVAATSMLALDEFSSAAEPLPGVPVTVSGATGFQSEPSIAINPTNPRNLVAGYIDNRRCGVANSFDAGLTWSTAILAESTATPPAGIASFSGAGDPVVEFGPDGVAYYLCMNTTTGNAQKTQFLYRSTDGGATWNDANPTLAVGPAYADDDKGHVVVDTATTSPNFGTIYVAATALPGPAGSGQLRLARSTDGGASFSIPVQVSDSDIAFAANLATGADGAVYAAWSAELSSNRGTSVGVRIDRSDDGGVTFGTDGVVAATGVVLGGVRGEPSRGNGFPYIGTHPSDPNIVYAVWAQQGVGPDDSDIQFSRSTDRGVTWSPSVRINTDVNPPGDFSSQFWPTMSVDPVTGDVDVIWYSDENDPDRTDGTPQIDLYHTTSRDSGLTFEMPARVTPTSSSPTAFSGFFGDYLGIDSFDGVTHPIWVDSTLGTSSFDTASTQIGGADLTIALSDDVDPAVAGGNVTYEATLTNGGPAEARDGVVTFGLPAGTSFVSATSPCVYVPPTTVECSVVAPIPRGASIGLSVTVAIPAALVHDAGSAVMLTTSATATSSQPDPVMADNTATESTVVLARSDLAVSDLTGTPTTPFGVVGDTVVVDLSTVTTNLGPSGPTDADVTFAASATAGASAVVSSPAYVADIAIGEVRAATGTATITCDAPGTHEVTFTTSISPDDPATTDPNPTNDATSTTLQLDCLTPVAIDIKPGNRQNVLNPTSKGLVGVALLTTEAGEFGLPLAFDAASVDIGSLKFGTFPVVQSGHGSSAEHGGHLKDVPVTGGGGPDGDIDLLVHFRTGDTGADAMTAELCLVGRYEVEGSDLGFVGCDTVRIVL